MKLLCLTACDFIVHKGHKIVVKFVLPTCGINFKIQRLTCFPINYCITIHHNIFLKSLLSKFPHHIIHQRLIKHFFIDVLLLLKFIQARLTDGAIRAKNNLVVLFDCVFDGFFKLFLCFHAVSTGYIQPFCKF